ncbi:unnamed protein product [Alopecurus aequalis]
MVSSPKLAAALLLALASAMLVTAQNAAEDLLNAHNDVRSQLGVGLVSWDPLVAAYAQEHANKQAATCQYVPSPEGRPYGENIFVAPGTDWKAVDALIYWVSEKQYYDHDTNTCSAPSGQSCDQYLQVVWSDTKAIGCGAVICDGNVGVFLMCSYSPPLVAGQPPY